MILLTYTPGMEIVPPCAILGMPDDESAAERFHEINRKR